MLRLGDMSQKRGELLKAETLWQEARLLFEKSVQLNAVTQIDERLANLAGEHQEKL